MTCFRTYTNMHCYHNIIANFPGNFPSQREKGRESTERKFAILATHSQLILSLYFSIRTRKYNVRIFPKTGNVGSNSSVIYSLKQATLLQRQSNVVQTWRLLNAYIVCEDQSNLNTNVFSYSRGQIM